MTGLGEQVRDSPRFLARRDRAAQNLELRRRARRILAGAAGAVTALVGGLGLAAWRGSGASLQALTLLGFGALLVGGAIGASAALMGACYTVSLLCRPALPVLRRLQVAVGLAPQPLDFTDLHPWQRTVIRHPQFRLLRLCSLPVVFASGLVALVAVAALTTRSGDLAWLALMIQLSVGPFWLVPLTAWRLRLELGPTGLRVVDTFRSRRLSWTSIEDVHHRAPKTEEGLHHRLVLLTAEDEVPLPVPTGRNADELEPLRLLLLRGRDLGQAQAGRPRDGVQD